MRTRRIGYDEYVDEYGNVRKANIIRQSNYEYAVKSPSSFSRQQ